MFDITQHELTPNYRILSNEEKQGVLDRFHLTDHNMPNVLVTDPLACFYGVKVGEVVEITKASEMLGSVYHHLDYENSPMSEHHDKPEEHEEVKKAIVSSI